MSVGKAVFRSEYQRECECSGDNAKGGVSVHKVMPKGLCVQELMPKGV